MDREECDCQGSEHYYMCMVRAVCEEEEAEDVGIEEAEAEAEEGTRRRRRSDRATQV